MQHKTLILSLLASGSLLIQPAYAAMTLNEYLESVKTRNLSYQSSAERAEGSALRAREADIFFTPQLFASAQSGYESKLGLPETFTYDKIESLTYSFGISQQFNFGLETKFGYEILNTNFVGADLGAVPTEYWDVAPKIEMSLPLWKNGFGRFARASQEVVRNGSLADQYKAKAESENILISAEIAYWRLSAAQELVKIQEQALLAGQNILIYVKRKFSKNLVDKADLLQAEALVENYQLQLVRAKNEFQSAQRSFSVFLYQDINFIPPELESLNYSALETVSAPAMRPGDRADLKAAEASARAAQAVNKIEREKNRPQFDIYGSYKLSGRGQEQNEAIKDVSGDRDAAFVGVRFQMPLNLMAASDAVEGARKNELAAIKSASHLRFEQDQAWHDITQKLEESKQALKLATKMELAQKAKLDNERLRLRQGRTTTYQVLLFEQEFSLAQAARVHNAAQILSLQSQIKLYQASSKRGS